jgi:hypothetical protein
MCWSCGWALAPVDSAEKSGRFPNLNVVQLRQLIDSYDGVVVSGAGDAAHVDPTLARQRGEIVKLGDDWASAFPPL